MIYNRSTSDLGLRRMRERKALEILLSMKKNSLWTYWGVKKRVSEKGPHVE